MVSLSTLTLVIESVSDGTRCDCDNNKRRKCDTFQIVATFLFEFNLHISLVGIRTVFRACPLPTAHKAGILRFEFGGADLNRL